MPACGRQLAGSWPRAGPPLPSHKPQPTHTHSSAGTHLELARRAKRRALIDLRLQHGVDLVVGVADDGRAPGADVVDVLVVVGVPAVSALDAVEHDGLTAHRFERAHWRVDTAGQEVLRLPEDLRAGRQG
eukprot:361791-Chlamydomonas_euryale.AAC.15